MDKEPRTKIEKTVKYIVRYPNGVATIDNINVARVYAEEKVEDYGEDSVKFYKRTTTVKHEDVGLYDE